MLRCRRRSDESQPSMKWTRGTTGAIASLSTGVYGGHPRLSLNTSTEGQFDLIINSTKPGDASSYSCTVGFEDALTADLVLLGRFY